MIRVENLIFRYKNNQDEVFNSGNLNIANGIWVLEGRNGSGKTTLLKILNDNYTDLGDIGEDTIINIKGKSVFLDDKIDLPYNLKEKDLANYIFKINEVKNNGEYVPIHSNKTLGMYSVGERKLAVLRIISELKFDILLIDEYLTNIDEINLIEVYKILNKLKDKGTLIIISSNDEIIKNKFNNKIIISNNSIRINRYE